MITEKCGNLELHCYRKTSEILPDGLCSEIVLAERNEWNPDCSTVNDKGHKESHYLSQTILWWAKGAKGSFHNAKIYLKEVGREDIRTRGVTECFPPYWWEWCEQCLSVVFERGISSMLWAVNASRALSSALGCAYTEPLGREIASKVHFQYHEGNCDRHLHNVSFQSRRKMKFNQNLTFLIIKTKWSLFTPSLLVLDKATNWWNLFFLHAESFLSKSSRFCYQADDKKNRKPKTTKPTQQITTSTA